MSIRPLAVFHSADLDGVCSGAIVKHFVPDVELVGFDYGQEFPWEKVDPNLSGLIPDLMADRRTVYMVDVSLPPADMKRLAEVSNLVVIDHHKTLIDSLTRDPIPAMCYVDTRWSGCELAWMYFTGMYADLHLAPEGYHKELPEAVRLLGRYDVFDKDNPEWESKIMPFQYGVRAIPGIYDPNCLMWQNLCWNPAGAGVEFDHKLDALNCGRAILRYQAEVNRRACETGKHEFTLHFVEDMWQSAKEIGYYFARYQLPEDAEERRQFLSQPSEITMIPRLRVLACNTIVFNTQFFDGFYDPEKHDVMCAYVRLADGRWKVSLYSTKPEIDCGAICKTFGGGGHVSAAGFICDKLPWEN